MGLDEIVVSQEINETDHDWIDDRSEPEVEFEPDVEQMHENELTNLRVLEWLPDLPADPKETILLIQNIDQTSIDYITHDYTGSNWVAPAGPLRVPASQSRSAKAWCGRDDSAGP